jgi:DNA-binding FadR family transcriptional regulator
VLSGNSRLATAWQPYSSTFGAVMDLTNAQDADLRPSFADRRDLLEAARAGERVKAQELLSRQREVVARPDRGRRRPNPGPTSSRRSVS